MKEKRLCDVCLRKEKSHVLYLMIILFEMGYGLDNSLKYFTY